MKVSFSVPNPREWVRRRLRYVRRYVRSQSDREPQCTPAHVDTEATSSETIWLRYQKTPGDDVHRPLLGLEIASTRGGVRMRDVTGVIDSGADSSVLPSEFAEALGYDDSELARVRIELASGNAIAWRALRPCRARVVGVPEVEFFLCPIFVENQLTALWGRRDFFTAFDVSFDERAQRFGIRSLLPTTPTER